VGDCSLPIVAELDQIDAAASEDAPDDNRSDAPEGDSADTRSDAGQVTGRGSDLDTDVPEYDVDHEFDQDQDHDQDRATHGVRAAEFDDSDNNDNDADTDEAGHTAGTDGAHRPARLSRWDRPPPPKDWRWWVAGTGKVMIATGLLLLGFVAYQLWGTGIETARAQQALEKDFDELLAIAPEVDSAEGAEVDGTATGTATGDDTDDATDNGSGDTSTGGGLATDDGSPPSPNGLDDGAVAPLPVESQNIPQVEGGDALARLEIPAIGVDDIVVAGVQTSDLKKGPGHFPETPLPGQLGNAAIAGHRTTYGQPFHNVDKLEWGDEIIVTTLTGRYVYLVSGQEIVSPSDYEVVTTVDPTVANLTLTSCHPKWTARERIIISSVLDHDRSDRVGEPVLNYGRSPATDESSTDTESAGDANAADPAITDASDGVSSSLLDTSTVDSQLVGVAALNSGAVDAGIADAFAEGWFSDPGAWWDVAMWASILVLFCLSGYSIAKFFRRSWIGFTVGVLPFVVALYFFYQNVNRLLPPNL
jgi:sortase A